MLDLSLAKLRLKEKNLTLAIVKAGNVIFETRSQGIVGLLQAIETLGKNMIASSVDKVVGRAAALLCVYSKVASVFAVTMSEEGEKVLERKGILYQFDTRVQNILNREGSDVCPFEKLTANCPNPKETYEQLKNCITLPFESVKKLCQEKGG